MCTYLRSLNEVDNCGNCKSLDIVLLDIQESNKSLSELRKRFSKLEEYNITLDIAFQNHKEQMILNNPDTKHKQLLVKIINNQSVEINDLKVIRKIKDENVSLAFQVSSLVKEREHKNCYCMLVPLALSLKARMKRRVSSTNASESKPRSNTKNDRILQPSSRSMKNKLEAHHRKFKSSANKNNHVSDCNTNVKNVALLKNSDTICLSCNECLFSANHDACVVQYLKKMQKRKMAKSAKQKVTSEWKPTGRIFKTVGLKWVPTGRMFTLVESKCSSSPSRNTTTKILPNRQIPKNTAVLVDVSCPKLSLRYVNTQESLLKCMINLDFHPFNLHEFGFEGIIRDEELPPWKFDYLGIVEIFLWCLDFGCSKHMIGHRDKLINFVSKSIRMVRFDNDHFVAIIGYGDLQMGNILILPIACYTQNRTLIHTRYDKTPYELLRDCKPELKYLHVFGALCYPTNDFDDLRKLKLKADIGIFIGFLPSKKAYRIYNKRTRQIMETMNVKFNELTHMASEQHGLGPDLQGLTSGHISLGLVLNQAASTSAKPPTLFQPMFDEYFKNPSDASNPNSATTLPPLDTAGASSFSTFIDKDAPSLSTSSNIKATNSPLNSINVEPNEEVVMFDSDTFTNPFAPLDTSSTESSSRIVDTSYMHTFQQPLIYTKR
ncbi:retrovirus-related pol polyprotein from transposon TNT 1-94 [Tanacetum coccineum]